MSDDRELQQRIDQGSIEQSRDAETYRQLYSELNQPKGEPVPGGFSFRVMDKLIRVRLRRAENQAKRTSMLTAVGLFTLSAVALFASIQLGWTEGAWTGRLPLGAIFVLGSGLILLTLLDQFFETTIEASQ